MSMFSSLWSSNSFNINYVNLVQKPLVQKAWTSKVESNLEVNA